MIGNEVANILVGGGGNDSQRGGLGDTLLGESGGDLLDGGAGADSADRRIG